MPGGRTALFLADREFGFEGGTELRVTLSYHSVYAQHVFGRVRLTPGRIGEAGLAQLPVADTRWYLAGPFAPAERYSGYDQRLGPEAGDVGLPHSEPAEPGNLEPCGQRLQRIDERSAAGFVLDGVAACERYFQAFNFVLWAGKSAREALTTALFETVGEA